MAMQIVCLVFSLVVATALADECPGAVGSNWVAGQDRCYRFVSRPMSWRSAQKYCSTLGFAGSLAFLDTDEASNSARSAVQSSVGATGAPDWMWIGITDEGNEGVWKSVDGVTVENPKFRAGQPDNAGGNEHYVHIHGTDWNWNDVPEASRYPFICQVEPATPDEIRCPMNWVERGGLCYKYIGSTLNWYDAQQRCEIMGNEGSLAFVGSEDDNNNVFEAAGTSGGDFWIGLADLRHEDSWSSPFGKVTSFTKWGLDEPNDLSGEDCVHVTTNERKWNDLDCGDYTRPFVCQRSALFSAQRCPLGDGWVQRGDSCYRYFRKSVTWNEALSECRQQGRGGTLPVILSAEQNNEVYEAAAMSAGGEYVDSFKNFWIGLTDSGHAGTWTGPDNVGQLGTYTAWAPDEPNDGGLFSSEEYVEMLVGTKTWNDENGHEDAFVCQLPAHADKVCECPECPIIEPCPSCPDCPPVFCPEPACPECPIPEPCQTCPQCPVLSCPTPPPCPPWPTCPPCVQPTVICPQVLPQPSCPELWTEFEGSCYLFNGKKLSWQAAKDTCIEDYGAHLVNVNAEGNHAEFLGNYIAMLVGGVKGKKSKVYAWVDLNDQEEEGVFVHGDGNAFEGDVNVKKQKKKKDCVLFKKGDLSHEKCSTKRVFVCKKSLY